MSRISNLEFSQCLTTVHYLSYGNIETWSEEEMAQTLVSIDAIIPALRLLSNRIRRQYTTALQADAVVVDAVVADAVVADAVVADAVVADAVKQQPQTVSDEEPDSEDEDPHVSYRRGAYREEDAHDYTIPESQLYGEEEEDLVLPPNVQACRGGAYRGACRGACRGAYPQQEDDEDDLMSLED